MCYIAYKLCNTGAYQDVLPYIAYKLCNTGWREEQMTLTGSGLGECRKRGSIGSLLAVGGIGKG